MYMKNTVSLTVYYHVFEELIFNSYYDRIIDIRLNSKVLIIVLNNVDYLDNVLIIFLICMIKIQRKRWNGII